MPRGIPKNVKLSQKCPPLLRQLIEQEGSRKGAAHVSKTGTTTIAKISDGVLEMTDAQRFRIEAALKGGPRVGGHVEREPEPDVSIPAWDGKASVYKYTTLKGKVSIRNMPNELLALVKQNKGNLNGTAKMAGFSSWSTVRSILEKDKYEDKLHGNVWCVLNGQPIKAKTNGFVDTDTPDAFTMSAAICIVTLAEFERLEEIAEVLGGVMLTKISAGPAWVVVYKFTQRISTEKFKKLAHRDAKRIVCP